MRNKNILNQLKPTAILSTYASIPDYVILSGNYRSVTWHIQFPKKLGTLFHKIRLLCFQSVDSFHCALALVDLMSKYLLDLNKFR